MEPVNFVGGGGLLRWYSPQGRSPAYPFFRKEKIHPHRRRRRCDAESPGQVLLRTYPVRRREYPARRKELFSLRKKRTAGIRLSAWQKAGSLYRLNHPFSALKKPLKIMGIQGESLPDAPPAAHLRIRRSRIPKCVVKQRTAETRGQSPRGLPLPRRDHYTSNFRRLPDGGGRWETGRVCSYFLTKSRWGN